MDRILQTIAMMKMITLVLIVLWTFGWSDGFAYSGRQDRPIGYRRGYLASVDGERDLRILELASPPQVPKEREMLLSEKIFTQKLKKEFKDRYREKFGMTEVERVYNDSNPFTYYETTDGSFEGTAIENSDEKREFGTYIFRRLGEFHFDNFAKNEPKVRPIWELKERIRKIKVEVSPGYELSANYSFSGNFLEVKFINPVVKTKLVLLMNPGDTGPSEVLESVVSMGYQLTSSIHLEAYYKDVADMYSLIGRKRLRSTMEANMTLSTGRVVNESLVGGASYPTLSEVSQVWEDRILVGFTWW